MEWSFTVSAPGERLDALTLVLSRVEVGERDASIQARELLQDCQHRQISLDGLIVCRRDFQVIGAGLALIQPDGSATVWAPEVVESNELTSETSKQVRTKLASAMTRWLWQSGVKLAQSLTARDDRPTHVLLESVGFRPLTSLACWKHELVDIPHAPLPDECDVTTYSEELAPRFEALMRVTMEQSADCVGLQGQRSAAECLSAHRHASQFDPTLWQIFHIENEDVGLLLCADHRDQRMWELLYVGVAPKFRKQGLGLSMVSDMLTSAQISGADAVLVAVDDSNIAAKSLYEACGFHAGFQKQIHVWTNVTSSDVESTACAQPQSLDDAIRQHPTS